MNTQPEHVLVPTTTDYMVPLQCFKAEGASSSTTVLLLPALGMAARFYTPMAQALSARGVNVVLFEQRGHGQSSAQPSRQQDYGFREWLQEDIPAALDWIGEHLGGAKPVLMGHSLGGHVAACYVGLHPDAVDRLILTACGSPWIKAYQGRLRWQIRALRRLIPVLGAALGYFPGHRFGFGGREARRMMDDWRRLVPDNVYHADGIDMDFEAGIARYAGAVLGIRFDADPMAPREATEAVLDKFESATVQRELLESEALGFRANHFMWVRQPDATAALIVDWLEKT